MNVIKYLSKSKATLDELTLEYWDIYISDGDMNVLYGNFHKIREIYIPELELIINQTIEPINIFLGSRDRYKPNMKTMYNKSPKLEKTIIITKSSEAAKTLIWLSDIYKSKKEKEKSLTCLFN